MSKFLTEIKNIGAIFVNCHLILNAKHMKQILLSLFSTILIFESAFTQEEIVNQIRQVYIQYNKHIEDLESGPGAGPTSPFKIKTVQVRPAMGPVDIEISYYFDEITRPGNNENMDTRNTTGTLRKVVYSESMPSFTDYREIFFDAKGNLMFYYSKLTGSTCGEKRIYFKLGKMIKIKFNPLGPPACPDGDDPYSLPDFTRFPGKFTKDDLDWEKWVLKYAGNHKKAFIGLFESLQ
jgi:hypothetical protein